MDNLSQTSSYWNWRFWPAINTIYAELFNVSPVEVPYSNLWRPTSYFLETRWSYREVRETRDWIWYSADNKLDYFITDCKLIYDDMCDETTWKLYVSYTNRLKTDKIIGYYKYKNWQLYDFQSRDFIDSSTTACNNDKLTVVNYVRDEIVTPKCVGAYGWEELKFYEENQIVDNVTMQWFLWLEQFDDSKTITHNDHEIKNFYDFMTYTWVEVWSYVFVHGSWNQEWDGACGQVRQIIGIDELGLKLKLSSAWLWLKDVWYWETTIRWKNIEVTFFKDWWETIFFADATWLKLLSEWEDRRLHAITICDYWVSMWAERFVVDTNIYDNIPVVLYSNWYIAYGRDWYNKFFFSTDQTNYVGKDKIWLTSWRWVMLVFGKRSIDVWVWDDNRKIIIYTQSNVVWIHNKWCYWEYEWSIVFLSSEQRIRLLSIQIKATTWHNMLEYEDIGWYIQSRLDKVREWDDLYLDTYDNELKIFQQTKTVLDNFYNDCTRIYFYNKKWKVWYEHLTYSLLRGNYKNFYYGSWIVVYTKYLENGDIATEDEFYTKDSSIDSAWKYAQRWEDIPTKISWYVNENEYGNWQQASDWSNLDLLRIIKPKSMNVLLWAWLYWPNFKINITNYRFWYWTVLELKDIYKKNKRFEDINYISWWSEPEPTECIEADVSDDRVFTESCESKFSLSDVERQPFIWQNQTTPYERWRDKIKVNDIGICVDWWKFKYSWCYPIYINFNETQSPSELVKVEIVGVGDSISFWWAIMELNTFPLDYKGTDWEYTLNFEDDCPKKFLHKPNNCFT